MQHEKNKKCDFYTKKIYIFFGAKHILCAILLLLWMMMRTKKKKNLTKVFLMHELIDDVVGLKI